MKKIFYSLKKNIKKFWKPCVAIIVLLFATLLIAEKSNSSLWQGGDITPDSNVFKYTARLMSEGGMPYRDSFDHKGPVIYFINYASRFIHQNRGIWVFEFIAIFISMFFFYQIPKKYFKLKTLPSLAISLICGALLINIIDAVNYPELFSLPLIAGSLYIFLDFFMNNKITTWRLILCGIMMGLAFMMKPNGAISWCVLSAFAIYKCIKDKKPQLILKFALWFILGFLIIIIPILIWLIANNAFGDFIDQVFIFNAQYSTVEERASWATRTKTLLVFLSQTIITFSLLLSILYYTAAKTSKTKFVLLVNTSTLVISLLICSISGAQHLHYGIILIPFIIIPYIIFFQSIQPLDKKTQSIALAILLFISINPVITPYINAGENLVTNYTERDQPHFSQTVRDICKIVKDRTSQEDKISVVGNWDLIYNKTNRFSTSKYSYQYNLHIVRPEIIEAYLNDLKANPPKLIIIQKKINPSAIRLPEFLKKYDLIYTEKDEKTGAKIKDGAKVYQIKTLKNKN